MQTDVKEDQKTTKTEEVSNASAVNLTYLNLL